MPNKHYAISMARYNSWQNDVFVKAASTLSYIERQKDRGAFFGSIQKTFSHILWGDQIWLSRFTDTTTPPVLNIAIPQSTQLFSDWDNFVKERASFDKIIIDWANSVEPNWFNGNLTWYSGAAERDITKPKPLLATHMFNHQTHHRGQIHAMLTAVNVKTGDTDMPFMPESYNQL